MAAKKAGAWLTSALTWLPLFVPTLAFAVGVMPVNRYGLATISPLLLLGAISLSWLLTAVFGARDSGTVSLEDAAGQTKIVAAGRMAGVAAVVAALGMGVVVAVGVVGVAALGLAGVTAVIAAVGAALVVAVGVMFVDGVVEKAGIVAFGVALGAALGVILVEGVGVAALGVPDVVVLGVHIQMASVVFSVAGFAPIGVAAGVEDVIKSIKEGRSSPWSKAVFAALILSYAVLIWIYWLGGWRVLNGV